MTALASPQPTAGRHDAIRGLSIRLKLFFLIGGLLVLVTVFYSWAADREMRSSALVATSARLDAIAVQWAMLLATSRQQQLTTFRRARDSAAVREFFLDPDQRERPTLVIALRALFRTDSQRPAVQLIDADHRELLKFGTAGAWTDPGNNSALLRAAATNDSGATGEFRAIGDSIVVASAVRVVKDGAVRGFVVSWGRIGTSPGNDQLSRLFGGPSTHLMLANRSGDVWTDLSHRVPSPNVDLSKASGLLSYRHGDAEPVFAIAKSVSGTPWAIVVEYSRAAAFAQAHEFLTRAWLVGAITLIVGALGVFGLSVSLTKPLARLTKAAEAVAAGDYTQQSGVSSRRDELGRLGAAFDSMVARVQDSFAARSTSEQRYRSLFEAVPLPQWVFDRETLRILAVNAAAIEHYGYSREEFLSMTLADLRPPEDVPGLRYAVRSARGPRHSDTEWRHFKKDGTLIEVETSAHAIDFDGSRARIVVIHDVTERNRAAEAIRQSEEKYRRLVREAPIGVTLTSIDGRFIVVNPAFAVMLAYGSEEDVLALNVRDVNANDEQWRGLLARFQKGGRIRREEIQLIRKDSTLITTQFTGRLVSDTVTSEQYVEAAWEDVTDQRRIERQFQQAQKMEAIGQLAGGVAHDFNNLLTVIISSSDLLLADSRADGALRADIESIRTAGQSAAALTRQLLAFSRQQVLQPRVMQLNDLVAGTGQMLQRLIGENIELVTTLARDAGTVKVDPGQMEQVIVNLAINARDAMPNGGRLLIESKNVDFGDAVTEHKVLYPPGKYVSLIVSDTGVGMDSETQSRVFEPFFTTKGAGEGTGLGLATVYGIVRQSGGFISLYSEPGEGTSFKIFFPRVDEAAQAIEQTPASREPLRGSETVLVVEDAPAVRTLIHRVLERLGYQVLEAHDGESALALSAIHDGPIHLLLTDVIMPRMGGRMLANQFALARPDARVLFVSGYTDDAIVRHGVLEPTVHYLEKPFTPDTLARKVRRVLDSATMSRA